MFKFITKESLARQKPYASFKPGLKLNEQFKLSTDANGRTMAEFIGSGNFAAAWVTRQRYEVDAGRDEEPILYTPLYSVVQDANLPKIIDVATLGPAGVVFEEIQEGGEVKFVTVGEGSKTVTIKHYAAGIEYTKDLIVYNQTWAMAPIERRFGQAHNALLNHIHLYPILAYSYTAANQTAADSTGSVLEEKYLRTLENGITNSVEDTTHPRRGPYDLLISTSDMFMVERALQRRLQDGIDVQSSAVNRIRNVIVYDGWTGTRGKKSTTYPGVTAGKGYLVSGQYRDQDFQSWIKQALQSQNGDGDLSRFIIEQVIYDTYFGVYANPVAAVEELTWPTS